MKKAKKENTSIENTTKSLETAISNVKSNRDSAKSKKLYDAENRLLNGLKTLLKEL
jgi:hypothetical protein